MYIIVCTCTHQPIRSLLRIYLLQEDLKVDMGFIKIDMIIVSVDSVSRNGSTNVE